MNLFDEVRYMGGAARTAELRERGHTDRAIRIAVGQGHLVRPRQGWVADSNLDPELTFAVKHGVVLSCVSLAHRSGLWVANPPSRPHVAVRSKGSHVRAPARVHWARPLMPRLPGALLDSLPNMLHHVVECLPFEGALTVWESALNKRRTDLQSLRALPLSSAATQVLEACTPFADSGLETIFRTRLKWLQVPIRTQVWLFGHRVDFLIGDRLVVQIDGKQHAGAQAVSDMKHDAELSLRQYHVIRVSYAQIMHDWPAVQEQIMRAIAAGLHLR